MQANALSLQYVPLLKVIAKKRILSGLKIAVRHPHCVFDQVCQQSH
jgi:hypothetical protein